MHVATFRWVVAHVSMFYIVRMVVKFMSIIGTYEVVQTRCRCSVSYSPDDTYTLNSLMYTALTEQYATLSVT